MIERGKALYNYLKSRFLKFFTKGHARSIKAKKHVAASFIFRGFSKALGFLLVPIALNYLDPTRYGIWLTVSSISGYLVFFDVGLGSGLRTKFAEAVASGDKEKARIYLSTTYAIITIVIITFFIIFLIINPFLNWSKILNTQEGLGYELNILATIVIAFFAFRFVFKLMNTLLLSDQRPAVREFILLVTQFLVVSIIYLLSRLTEGSLITFGLIYSGIPVVVLIFVSIYFFRNDYNEYTPSIKLVNFRYTTDLLNLSYKFFIIKIAAVILLSTDNLIITQLYDPSSVTTYQIAQKYFFLIVVFFSLIINPFWSAVTEAYHKNELAWIRNSVRKLLKVWGGFVVLTITMLLISNWAYVLWVGNKVHIPFTLSAGMAVFVIIRTLNSPFSSFLNGVGKVKIQMYLAIFVSIVNIPLSIILAKYLGLGITGVITATTICMVLYLIVRIIQYYKLINNKAKGIWNA